MKHWGGDGVPWLRLGVVKLAAWIAQSLRRLWHRGRRGMALWRATSLTKLFDDASAQTTAELGLLGEHIAVMWLRRQGHKVLYRNYQHPDGGEVDVVCRAGDVLVFAEVKTRRREIDHRPADAVGQDKQRLIIKAAREWLRRLHDPRVNYRYDIIEVLLHHGEPPEVRVIENAFQERGRR
jgi:putative endonuclease